MRFNEFVQFLEKNGSQKWGIEEHVAVLNEMGLPIPESSPSPTVVIKNEGRDEAAA